MRRRSALVVGVTSVMAVAFSGLAMGGIGGTVARAAGTASPAAVVAGVWGNAQPVPGSARPVPGIPLDTGDGQVLSVSCASDRNCTAAGYYTPADSESARQWSVAFVATETNGTWGGVREVAGIRGLATDGFSWLTAVSCTSATDCAAGGSYQTNDNGQENRRPFLVTESGGTWGSPVTIHGGTVPDLGSITDITCPSTGSCVAISGDQAAFAITEASGGWESPQPIHAPAGATATGQSLTSLTCPSATDCTVGGSYQDHAGHRQAFLESEKSGTWGAALAVPGVAALNAGGSAGVTGVSCSTATRCEAIGSYANAAKAPRVFVVAEVSRTTTTLTLSAPKVTYGHEQSERLSVTVSAGSGGGKPTGKVVVKAGSAPACTITLGGGKGSCALNASKLRAGTYHLVGFYLGDGNFAKAASPAKTLTVTK